MADLHIRSDFQGFNFGFEYHDGKQVFKNAWTKNIVGDEVVKLRHTEAITDEDLLIVKFIYKHSVATVSIIRDLTRPEAPLAEIKDVLERLLRSRFLNKFAITVYKTDEYPEDALDIYCLDYGGRKLLMHYGDPEDEAEKWTQSATMMSIQKVSEKLITADFHVQLMKNCGTNLEYLQMHPVYRRSKDPTSPNFEFCIKNHDTHKYFLGVVVRETNFQPYFRDLMARIDDLVSSKAWKRYFYDELEAPVVIVIAESDSLALEAAKLVNQRTSIRAIRYTTDERMHQTLSNKGAFLKFVKEDEDENHPDAHLVAIKAGFFSKPE